MFFRLMLLTLFAGSFYLEGLCDVPDRVNKADVAAARATLLENFKSQPKIDALTKGLLLKLVSDDSLPLTDAEVVNEYTKMEGKAEENHLAGDYLYIWLLRQGYDSVKALTLFEKLPEQGKADMLVVLGSLKNYIGPEHAALGMNAFLLFYNARGNAKKEEQKSIPINKNKDVPIVSIATGYELDTIIAINFLGKTKDINSLKAISHLIKTEVVDPDWRFTLLFNALQAWKGEKRETFSLIFWYIPLYACNPNEIQLLSSYLVENFAPDDASQVLEIKAKQMDLGLTKLHDFLKMAKKKDN